MGVLPLEKFCEDAARDKRKITGEVAISRKERRKNGASGNSAIARM